MKKIFILLYILFLAGSACNYTLSLPPPPAPKTPSWAFRVRGDTPPADSNVPDMSSKVAQELYNQGMNFYNRGLYKPASERFTLALQEDKSFIPAYLSAAKCYFLIKEWHMAEVTYQKLLKLKPDLLEAQAGLGILYYKRESLTLAYNQLTGVLEKEPQHVDALEYLHLTKNKLSQKYLNQGIEFYDSAKLERAIKRFRLAIQFNPKNGRAYLELGRLYLDQGQWQPAVDNLKQGLKIMPDIAGEWKNLGKAYLGRSDYYRARQALQKSLLKNPQDNEAEKLIKQAQKGLYKGKSIPSQVLEICSSRAITRAQLAALLALNLRFSFDRGNRMFGEERPTDNISDISSHWAKKYINYVLVNKLMSASYNSNRFLPEAMLSRGELADIVNAILQRAGGQVYTKISPASYKDVSPGDRYYNAVTKVANLKLISPQTDKIFGINNRISGVEALEIMDRLTDCLAQ